ncbi:hypothetical protein IAT38_002423 [Cryptococcus sp. DSM 104549]
MPPPITITYTLHPSPSTPSSTSPILQNAIAGIRAHLPLRNLHWKSSSRTSLRTIQEVDVELVELGEVTGRREGAGGVLEMPLVNMCLVVCEDAEVYKNQTRNFLRDWLSLLAARRTPHAPLIVLVNPPSAAEKSGKSVWGKDKGVLGKLKTDFNVGKRDRCVQLNLPPPGTSDPAAWPEVLNKLKESFVSAFDEAIMLREEEVKRGEAQRVMVGWNFCTWFLLKESLAQSFETVNLPEDSLIIYEELEASFFQVLKEQNLSWLSKLGGTGPQDDSLPILDTSVKPYRELLRNSAISIFDFRVYVFARQGVLLGKLGRITEVAKRGQWFVASLTRRLRESETDLPEHFIESWTYTACMDIVAKCDQWSRIDRPNNDYSGLIAYESARSELLDIARIQVERLGVAAGHLPNTYPFQPPSAPIPTKDDVLFEGSSSASSSASPPASPRTAPTRPPLSNQVLLDALSDPQNFTSLYTALTQKSLTAYEKCGKLGSAVRLKADLAALAANRQDWEQAYTLSRGLAKECAELRVWEPVGRWALEGALKAHGMLGGGRDRHWGDLGLAYLRVCAVHGKGEEVEILEGVVEGLRESEVERTAGTVDGHKAFAVRMVGDEAAFEGDQTVVPAIVTNALDVPVQIDGASLELVDLDGEIIVFSAEKIELQPGTNTLNLFCSTSTQGVYTLHSASVLLGKINFAYSKADEGARLKVRRRENGVAVKLRMPYDLKLDADSRVVLEVKSGEVAMRNAAIGLRSLTGEVGYILDEATCGERELDTDEQSGAILLGDVGAGEVLEVAIPYTGVAPGEFARAQIFLQYEGPAGVREWVDSQGVLMSLPLTVNVQDFFRPECLLSHFTIVSDGRDALRIASVALNCPEGVGYDIDGCRKEWEHPLVISSGQPLSCLFKVRREARADPAAVLRLLIKYRILEDEIKSAVQVALQSLPLAARTPIDHAIRKLLTDRARWKSYLLGDSLASILGPVLKGVGKEEDTKAFIEALSEENKTVWRTLEIPVDVPQRRLLTSIRMTPQLPASGLIYQGRAIPISLRLSTSSQWMGSVVTKQEEEVEGSGGGVKGKRLVFDVQASNEDWLVLGKKKGYYTADPDKPEEQQIILVPIRAGNLFLPNVTVQLLDPGSARPARSAPAQGQAQVQSTPEVLCESHVENAAQAIRVLPAKREATAMVSIALGEGWEGERMMV